MTGQRPSTLGEALGWSSDQLDWQVLRQIPRAAAWASLQQGFRAPVLELSCQKPSCMFLGTSQHRMQFAGGRHSSFPDLLAPLLHARFPRGTRTFAS